MTNPTNTTPQNPQQKTGNKTEQNDAGAAKKPSSQYQNDKQSNPADKM